MVRVRTWMDAGILVVVAIGVALGVFCGGLLLACVVVYMKRSLSFILNVSHCTRCRKISQPVGHSESTKAPLHCWMCDVVKRC